MMFRHHENSEVISVSNQIQKIASVVLPRNEYIGNYETFPNIIETKRFSAEGEITCLVNPDACENL